jgi:hypothetical protein
MSVYLAGELGFDPACCQISEASSISVQLNDLWEHCGSGSRGGRGDCH